MAAQKKTKKPAVKPANVKTNKNVVQSKPKKSFPDKFPFWARLKISKNRTTLVIDETDAYNKVKKRMEPGFLHREAIHPDETFSNVKGYEEIKPNPDKSDKRPMFLKAPSKLPKRLFSPHNKNLKMPKNLIERYRKKDK